MKKNSKGFTIVELVIVIAVVAILAAVMIPTFSGIIKKANLSADLQIVRNMNTILASEVNAPATVAAAAAVLEANGIDKFEPTSKLHSFCWFSTKNRVILVNENKLPVYPEEYLGEIYNEATWFDLRYLGNTDATTALPEEPDLPPSTEGTQYRVTYEVNNIDYLDLDQCIFTDTATKGEEFWFTVAPINSNYLITKILLVMNDGENKIERTNRDPIDDKMSFGIPNVTGDIEVSITVEKAFKVTVENADGSTGADTDKIRKVASGLGIAMSHDDLVIEGKKIKSVKVVYTATGEEYNDYSYSDHTGLDIKEIRADLTIIVETE